MRKYLPVEKTPDYQKEMFNLHETQRLLLEAINNHNGRYYKMALNAIEKALLNDDLSNPQTTTKIIYLLGETLMMHQDLIGYDLDDDFNPSNFKIRGFSGALGNVIKKIDDHRLASQKSPLNILYGLGFIMIGLVLTFVLMRYFAYSPIMHQFVTSPWTLGFIGVLLILSYFSGKTRRTLITLVAMIAVILLFVPNPSQSIWSALIYWGFRTLINMLVIGFCLMNGLLLMKEGYDAYHYRHTRGKTEINALKEEAILYVRAIQSKIAAYQSNIISPTAQATTAASVPTIKNDSYLSVPKQHELNFQKNPTKIIPTYLNTSLIYIPKYYQAVLNYLQ